MVSLSLSRATDHPGLDSAPLLFTSLVPLRPPGAATSFPSRREEEEGEEEVVVVA
jgi:hypothetical protein